MKKFTGIIIGAILVALGVTYILSILGIVEINILLDGWWTLFIIIPCLNGLLTNKDKLGSLAGLSVGILLLLAAQNVLEYDMVWKIIVPVIIILVGIKIIENAVRAQKGNQDASVENGQEEHIAAFRSGDFDYTDEEIRVAKIGAVFGGAKCNLANAKIKNGSRLDLFCAFGGADIIVPENVNVKINTFCLFGGISDKRASKPAGEDSVTLIINGFCIFGGADIK